MTITTLHSALYSAAALAALVAGSPALAAQIEAKSRISNVIVYPDSARIARVMEVELPAGATSILLRGLPLNLDPASLRVEGEGSTPFSIGSAQTRVAPTDPKAIPESAARRLRDLQTQALTNLVEQAGSTSPNGRRPLRRLAASSPK